MHWKTPEYWKPERFTNLEMPIRMKRFSILYIHRLLSSDLKLLFVVELYFKLKIGLLNQEMLQADK